MYSVRQYDVNFSFHCRSIKAIWLLCNKQNLLKQMRLLEQNNSRHCVKIRWSMHSEGLRLEKKMYNSYKRQPLGHRTPTFTCKLLRENRVCLLVAYLFGAPHCMAFAQSYPNCSRWLHNVSFVFLPFYEWYAETVDPFYKWYNRSGHFCSTIIL